MWTMILADDEPLILKGLEKLLSWEKLGITIVGTSCTGDGALALILERKPDIAILDISMPGKTGLEILKRIRQVRLATKVILVSGFQEFDYAVQALRLGAVNYLIKPLEREQLLESIQSCVPIDARLQEPEHVPVRQAAEQAEAPKLSTFIPVIYHILEIYGQPAMERRLIQFAVENALQRRITEQDGTVAVYEQEPATCLLFKDTPREQIEPLLEELAARLWEECQNHLAFLIGPTAEDITAVEACVNETRMKGGCFYFERYLQRPIMNYDEALFGESATLEDLKSAQRILMSGAITSSPEEVYRQYSDYCKVLCQYANGDRILAVFKLFTVFDAWNSHLALLGLDSHVGISNVLLGQLEAMQNFSEITQHVWTVLEADISRVRGDLSHAKRRRRSGPPTILKSTTLKT